jgi:hypothetical protein
MSPLPKDPAPMVLSSYRKPPGMVTASLGTSRARDMRRVGLTCGEILPAMATKVG